LAYLFIAPCRSYHLLIPRTACISEGLLVCLFAIVCLINIHQPRY
jgi:hypothetical protein